MGDKDVGPPAPFFVFALPRSRTAWLAKFLSYGHWECVHDPSALWHSREDLRSFCRLPFTGACDSGLAFLWEFIREVSPHSRFAVVRRERAMVEASLAKFDLTLEPRLLDVLEKKLDEISALPDTLTLAYDDLYSAHCCGSLMNHCVLQPFDPIWFKALHNVNIQGDMREMLAKIALNRDGLAKVYQGVLE